MRAPQVAGTNCGEWHHKTLKGARLVGAAIPQRRLSLLRRLLTRDLIASISSDLPVRPTPLTNNLSGVILVTLLGATNKLYITVEQIVV